MHILLFMRILFALLCLLPLEMIAQPHETDPGISLHLINEQTGQEINNVYFDKDRFSIQLSVDSNKWNGKSYYPVVFYYSTLDNSAMQVYPRNESAQLFPSTESRHAEKTFNPGVKLQVGPPFGIDNYVLILSEVPIDLSFLEFNNDHQKMRHLQMFLQKKPISPFSLSATRGSMQDASKLVFKTIMVEAKEAANAIVPVKSGVAQSKKMVFYNNDSTEVFTNPVGKDLSPSDYPVIDIIEPLTGNTRGPEEEEINTSKVMIRGQLFDWNGIKTVKINNSEPAVLRKMSDQVAYFEHMYELVPGTNQIDVVAENHNAFTKTKKLSVKAKEGETKEPGKNYLLLIGINNYIDKSWPMLHNAVKDVQDFKKIITRYNFNNAQVIELYNSDASRKNILERLRLLRDKLTENDNLLIYYSGHGYYEGKTGYWVPAEGKGKETEDFISNYDITRYLQEMKARHILMIADACYSGSFLKSGERGNKEEKYMDKVKKFRSRMVLASGRIEKVSDGRPGENSPFAQQVLKFFNSEQKKQLLGSDLIRFVKINLESDIQQSATSGIIDETGDEDGDFVFERTE